MFALFKKEVSSFLSSLTGYIVITIFLLAVGLFLWVFPGNFNILDAGYTSLESLFVIAPWMFMFLIPAVTMRLFSEEMRNGTMEVLLTRPISEWQIVLAKYLAGFLLVILALLPTFIYYFSLQTLGNPPQNIDVGATWGSYFGLLFLGGSYVSIGVFASSLTENQLVAFILAFFLCFFCYFGFDAIAQLPFFQAVDEPIINLGINAHFASMSRGVLDTRDMLYFLGFIFFFLACTRFKIQSRNW
ncbi:MAG: gliding motility-associated ABC transporter permease subunit GldF [Bacteroidia bacterium]|jgi:ABC-2 type transport system permease protein